MVSLADIFSKAKDLLGSAEKGASSISSIVSSATSTYDEASSLFGDLFSRIKKVKKKK